MAYLDNTTVTVDAVLTKKGRERLSQGRDQFNITQFAIADDEIDYSLYNTAHPLGSNYYSNIIESMPVLEAIPDESQVMRYKLVTLSSNKGITRIPQISLGGLSNTFVLNQGDGATIIAPRTTAIAGDCTTQTFDVNSGYTLILYDEDAATVTVPAGATITAPGQTPQAPVTPTNFDSLINFSSNFVIVGTSFQITPKYVDSVKNTKITIFGNESGATTTITLTVNPRPTS